MSDQRNADVSVAQCKLHPDEWRIECPDCDEEGGVQGTIFSGPRAELRARGYARRYYNYDPN